MHCPNMVIKLSMYVCLHDVYPTMDVNFAFWKEVKIAAACNFISLGEKMRELLHKNGKRKKRRKLLINLIGQNRREICALCRSVSWRSWMIADKAGSKFQPLDALWTKEHNFRKISVVITSGIRYRLDAWISEKFRIFVLSGWVKWS